MADLSLNCPKCGEVVSVPIEADVSEYVCTHCGATNQIYDDAVGSDFKDPLVGAQISEWEVQEKVGEGGFGAVYRAYDNQLQRSVAIKVMLPSLASNPEFVKKFFREAITAAQLNHPNIVGIHRVGRDEQRNLHFLVMEFLEGETFMDLIENEGPLGVEETVGIILQCADALAVAHDKKIMHRDIKPENIMLDKSGVVKIMDFGLAKTVSTDMRSTKVMGTPHFMSPEQFEGKAADGRTDIYSLGVTFYYALSKAKPHEGTNTVQIIYSILTQEPKPLTELNPEVPEEIWRIIRKMIAKSPDDRYLGFREVRRDLLAFQDGVQAQRVTCPQCGSVNVKGRKFCRECGANLMVKCPSCGNEDAAGTAKCSGCGANIGQIAQIRENLERAKKLKAFGDLKRASAFYQEVLDLDPEHEEATAALEEIRQALAEIDERKAQVDNLVEQGDAEGALKVVEDLLASFPKIEDVKTFGATVKRSLLHRVVDAHVLVAEKAIAEQRFEDALESFEKAVKVDPARKDIGDRLRELRTRLEAVEQTLASAEAALSDGRHADAMKLAHEVLTLKPDHARAAEIHQDAKQNVASVESFLNEARELLDRGDLAQALTRLEMASEIGGGDDRVRSLLEDARSRKSAQEERVALVRKLIADGQIEEAASGVEDLLAEYPDLTPAISLKREVDRLLAENSAREEVQGFLDGARKADEEGEFDRSLQLLEQVLERDPDLSDAVSLKKRVQGRLREADELRATADRHIESGAYDKAIGVLTELSELKPGHDELREELEDARQKGETIEAGLRRAKEALNRKRFDIALQAADAVLEIAPQNHAAVSARKEAVRGSTTLEKHLAEARKLIESELFEDALAELNKARDMGAQEAELEPLVEAATEGRVVLQKSEATRAFVFKDFQGAEEKYQEILSSSEDDPEAQKGLKLARKMIRRSERESILPKALVAAVAAFALFFVQFQATHGVEPAYVDPLLAQVEKLREMELDAQASRDGWKSVESEYDRVLGSVDRQPPTPEGNTNAAQRRERALARLEEGRKFAAAVAAAFAAAGDGGGSFKQIDALETALGLTGDDPAAATGRTTLVNGYLQPVRERSRGDRESKIAELDALEASGRWDDVAAEATAAAENYRKLGRAGLEDTVKELEDRAGFASRLAETVTERPEQRLGGLRTALENVGGGGLGNDRRDWIKGAIGVAAREWIEETARRDDLSWSQLVEEYGKIEADPVIAADRALAREVSDYGQFASAMVFGEEDEGDKNYGAAYEAFGDARDLAASLVDRAGSEASRKNLDDYRRRAGVARDEVESRWQKDVADLLDAARRAGPGMNAETYYKKVVSELAKMKLLLEGKPSAEALFEKVK